MIKIDIDLNFRLFDIGTDKDGGPSMVESEPANRVMAHLLRSSQAGDPMKFYDWMVDFHRTGRVSVDESDWNTLRKFVHEAPALNMGKAQLLRALDAAKASAVSSAVEAVKAKPQP